QHYEIDNKQIVAVGYSNGANIAVSMVLLRPKILSPSILFRTIVPLRPEKQPNLSSIHVFISAASFPPILAASKTKKLDARLRSAGADATIRFVQGGHGLTRDDVDLAREWLSKSVGKSLSLRI